MNNKKLITIPKYELIHNDVFMTGLSHNTCDVRPFSYEEISWIHILETHFNLIPYIVDRMKWIYLQLKDDRCWLCGSNVKFENIALAVMIFAIEESGRVYPDLGVTDFIDLMYKEPDRKKNTIQVWGLLQTIQDLFS